MTTTPKGHRRVVLNDFKAKKAEEGAIDIETDAGTFTIPPPELWPDDTQDYVRNGDNVGLTKLLLGGDEEYAKFVAAGGSASIVGAILADELGATPGK